MWNNLSMKQNHELASLPACWQARCGRRIEAHLPASSPEVSDDDQTMEDVSDNKPNRTDPCRLHHEVGAYTLLRRLGGRAAGAARFGVRLAQEEQHYNLGILHEHRLTEGQIVGEQVNENAASSMVTENPGFLDEQQALYQSCATPTTFSKSDGGCASYGERLTPSSLRLTQKWMSRRRRGQRTSPAQRRSCRLHGLLQSQRPRGRHVHVDHGPYLGRRHPHNGLRRGRVGRVYVSCPMAYSFSRQRLTTSLSGAHGR